MSGPQTVPAGSLGRLVTVLRDGSDGVSHTLTGEAADVGRSEGTVVIADDPFLAPRHARIERRGAFIVLVPLEDTNGVYVRLKKDEKHALVDGDRLLLGREVLRFELLPRDEREAPPALEHGVRIFASPMRPAWGRLRQLILTGVTRDVFHLAGTEIVLGRDDGDWRFPDDEFMSRRHARFGWTAAAGRAELQDLDSSNGTYVRVRGERPLRPGDQLRVGDQVFRWEPLG